MPIAIYEKGTDRRLFTITREQLDELVDALEEENEGDHDYYIDAAVCDFLDGKVDPGIVTRLREALAEAQRERDNELADEDEDELDEGEEDEDEMAELEEEEDYDDDEEDEYEEDEETGIEIVWREEK